MHPQALQAKLPQAASLAALQGLMTKAKKQTEQFNRECTELDDRMRPFVLDEPMLLAQVRTAFCVAYACTCARVSVSK